MARRIEDYRKVLVVEGYSDLTFLAEMLEHVGKLEEVFIKQLNGKGDFPLQLETLITPQILAEKTHIAIVVDADQNAAGTLLGFQTRLEQLTGQKVPGQASWSEGIPKVGLFIAPDEKDAGEIETLVWRAWSAGPANANAVKCIEAFRDCMSALGFKAQSADKGLIGSLLAIRNDDDPRLGPGARANVFDLDAADLSSLRGFLSGF